MIRKGTRRAVDAEHWRGRLDVAQAYLKVAEDALELADPGQNCIPIVGNIALGAIAYSDSLTARFAQVTNTTDHAQAPKLLKEVLGDRLPQAQQTRLSRLIGRKDEAHYGPHHLTRSEARKVFDDFQKLAIWVEDFHASV